MLFLNCLVLSSQYYGSFYENKSLSNLLSTTGKSKMSSVRAFVLISMHLVSMASILFFLGALIMHFSLIFLQCWM